MMKRSYRNTVKKRCLSILGSQAGSCGGRASSGRADYWITHRLPLSERPLLSQPFFLRQCDFLPSNDLWHPIRWGCVRPLPVRVTTSPSQATQKKYREVSELRLPQTEAFEECV